MTTWGNHFIRVIGGHTAVVLECSCGWDQEFDADPPLGDLEHAANEHRLNVEAKQSASSIQSMCVGYPPPAASPPSPVESSEGSGKP